MTPDDTDIGDVLEVPDSQQLDKDPDPKKSKTHAALEGGPDDVSDVEEGEVVEMDFDDEGGDE